MWWTGLCLAAGLSAFGVPGAGVVRPTFAAKAHPTLSAELFTQHWPMTLEIEKPHLREKLHRLVQVTPAGDPDKARFWFLLAEVETERWRSQQAQARVLAARVGEAPGGASGAREGERRMLAGRAEWSWEDAVGAYASAAEFPTFERRDAALYWLTRLYLARQ
jgi:hypothetical protein